MSTMGVKRGTQTFSKAEQPSALKSDPNLHTNSATDIQQAYGDQKIGDVLNKIADPNWVDPSKKMRTTGDPNLGKDAFMKLMLTQMKYQDPTSPMQSHEMAAQLAQFSSLEQLSNIHGTLESMKTQSSPSTNYQALALIGKRVAGDSSKLSRAAGDTKHGIGFELLGDAASVKITVKDSTGAVIRKIELGPLKKGQNTVDWNGLKDDGTASRPGEYRIAVEGLNTAGKKVFAKTAFGGKITGLNFTPEGPVLLVGNKSIKLADVKKIEDSADEAPNGAPAVPLKAGEAAKAEAQPKSIPASALPPAALAELKARLAPPPPGPSETPVKPEGKSSGSKAMNKAQGRPVDDNVPPAEDGPAPGNIESVPMARELMTQLEKQI